MRLVSVSKIRVNDKLDYKKRTHGQKGCRSSTELREKVSFALFKLKVASNGRALDLLVDAVWYIWESHDEWMCWAGVTARLGKKVERQNYELYEKSEIFSSLWTMVQ